MSQVGGDRKLEALLRDHAGLISRVAASYEADLTLQQDLSQEILLAVWQALPRFRGEATLRTFIARIAQNRAASHVARRMRAPPLAEVPMELASDAPSPEERAGESLARDRLLERMRTLPLPQREVLVLMLEGFSFAEIAESLQVSANAAMLRCQRAKQALRTIKETL